MHTEQLLQIAVPLTYLAMVGIERWGTGRRWPERRGWQLTGVAFFLMLGSINVVAAMLLGPLLRGLRILDGAQWSLAAQAVTGYLLLSLGNALTHRAYHRFDWLWRHVHRLHHTPQRLDVAGVMYQTPQEAAVNAVLFLGVCTALGLSPTGSALVGWLAAFYGMFQHFNCRTPPWLGWLIQRPEAHCLHHRHGVHAYNYSDLPLWDLVWGTFRNPREFAGPLGFPGAAPVADLRDRATA